MPASTPTSSQFFTTTGLPAPSLWEEARTRRALGCLAVLPGFGSGVDPDEALACVECADHDPTVVYRDTASLVTPGQGSCLGQGLDTSGFVLMATVLQQLLLGLPDEVGAFVLA